MSYGIYIGDYKNTQVLQFPTLPKDLPAFSNDSKNEEFETYWDLPYNFIEKKGLLHGSWDGWLPVDASKYNFLKSKVNAKQIIDLIENAKTNTEPIKLLITCKDGYYVNDTFSIEKFEHHVTKNGDYNYSIEVKQWRDYSTIIKVPVTQGWNQDSTGWWYVYDANGNYYKNSWQLINNYWYYFKADGYIIQSNWFQDGAKWYYLGSDGAMWFGGTATIDGVSYTFNDDGSLVE